MSNISADIRSYSETVGSVGSIRSIASVAPPAEPEASSTLTSTALFTNMESSGAVSGLLQAQFEFGTGELLPARS